MTYLNAIITPEPTFMPQIPNHLDENRVFGAIKTMTWVGVSVVMGMVLATLCN